MNCVAAEMHNFTPMEILLVLFGIGIGAGIALLVARSRFTTDTQKMTSSILIEQERNKTMDDQLRELKRDLENERQKVLEANNSLAAAEADYRNIQEKLQDQKKELENLTKLKVILEMNLKAISEE